MSREPGVGFQYRRRIHVVLSLHEHRSMAWAADEKDRPHKGAGIHCRSLDRRRCRHETELLHLVELVEVDASLSDLSILDTEELNAVADNFLVGWRDRPGRGVKGGGVSAFHLDFLDDPGAARDLAADLHLAVWECLEPGRGVGCGVLGVGGFEVTRCVELDVIGVKCGQRLLVVGVECGYESVGRVFDFRHCVSSLGSVREAGGQEGYCHRQAGNRESSAALASVQERSSAYQKWLRRRANIPMSNDPASCPSRRPLPSSMHRRLTFAAC